MLTSEPARIVTDESPDPKHDLFVLVNPSRGHQRALQATAGGRPLRLEAGPGCGAIGRVAHQGSYRAIVYEDGRQVAASELARSAEPPSSP